MKLAAAKFLEPFLRAETSAKVMLLIGSGLVLSLTLIVVFAQFISPSDPLGMSFQSLQPPSIEHLMGTDTLGRDILSRVIYGGRASMTVAFLSVLLALLVGAPFGSLSGYFGGTLDRIGGIVIDALYAFPSILLAILIASALGPGVMNTAIAVGFSMIAQYFRVVRSITLSIKERLFVEAEKALGAGDFYIIFRHVMPYCVSSLIALITLSIAYAIISVAGLGFLGIGIPPPTPEWGTDLNLGRQPIASGVWWPTTFPGLMTFVAVLGFNMLGDGLDAIFNPAARKRL
jgi:peptide/nickel transport system permease protein